MLLKKKLKPRDIYLDKLIAFKDTEPVKVVTGIRRCGKSSLLKLMQEYLLMHGIAPEQIIDMNFEVYAFNKMTADELYKYITEKILPKKKMYIFFDEIQRITGWENVINSFRVEMNCDIYVTGSNAYLLSSEYATYLSGRCVEIKMLPLSFKEFLCFYDFTIEQEEKILGKSRKLFFDAKGKICVMDEIFSAYVHYGGMPGIVDVGLKQENALSFLEGIYTTVVTRDILEREKRRGQRQITDPELLRKLIMFLADNIGNNVSARNIGNTLIAEGLLARENRRGTPSTHTIQAYLGALLEAYIFYEVKRFDIKGKDFLKTMGKYYIADSGLRNYLVGFRQRDRGHMLENVVYFELRRRGYDVAVGKIDTLEIDFIATKGAERLYVQVTETMIGKDVWHRELAPLQKVQDNYEKIVLTMDPTEEYVEYGIKICNLPEWLLE